MCSEPSALAIGWAPDSLRSMIARRRWARPARPSGETQVPAPSGPRTAIDSRRVSSSARSMGGAEAPYAKIPAIPHIAGSDPSRPGESREVVDGLAQPFVELRRRVPAQFLARERDVGLALHRV